MADNIYYPPDKWYGDDDSKLIFLAGPKSMDNWQQQIVDLLSKEDLDINIANPFGNNKAVEEAIQISWGLYHIRFASAIGIIIFWISKDCHDEKIIFQLGEWLQNLKYRRQYQPERPLNIMIGIEEGTYLEKYLLFRITDELPDLPIFSSISDICKEIINSNK